MNDDCRNDVKLDQTVTRRRTLTMGGGLLVTTLAGCTGSLNSAGSGDEGETEGSVGDPETVPEDANCSVCNMMPKKFPEWNAQLQYADDERAYFCSPGCMAAYYADPGHFAEGRTQEEIEGVWVHDFDSHDRIDGLLAFYTLETDPERIDDPMMVNPLPFADREAALAYVEQYDDLDDEDVIELAAFDRELAEQYRSKFF